MNKKFSMELTTGQIKTQIKNTFKEEYAEEMSEAIVDILKEDDTALSILFKASLHILPEIKYKVGEEIIVHLYGVSTWKFNSKNTEKAGLLKDSHIKVKIIKINKYKANIYDVKFKAYDDDNKQISVTSSLDSTYIKGYNNGELLF